MLFLFFAWLGTMFLCVMSVIALIHSPFVYNLSWGEFTTSFVSMWSAEPLVCIFFVMSLVYFIGLSGLFFAQSGAVLANITTNEIENRHRLNYVVYPGRTVWSSSRSWVNFVDFFGWSKERPQIDWATCYTLPASGEV